VSLRPTMALPFHSNSIPFHFELQWGVATVVALVCSPWEGVLERLEERFMNRGWGRARYCGPGCSTHLPIPQLAHMYQFQSLAGILPVC
jgi:hypothetical protein